MKIDIVIVLKLIELGREIVRGFTFLGCFYLGGAAIASLAGKKTEATFLVSYLTSSESSYGLPWILAGVFGLFAFAQYKLRKRKTEYFQGRIKELELKIDRNRSSSGLTSQGDTNPRDKL